MALNDKVTQDIDFLVNAPRLNFHDGIIATMNINSATAQLGWKTSDEKERALAHQLNDISDVEKAFKTILDIQRNPWRKKGVVLEIIHLVRLSKLMTVTHLTDKHNDLSESSTNSTSKEER